VTIADIYKGQATEQALFVQPAFDVNRLANVLFDIVA
jgi:hypothetical protein